MKTIIFTFFFALLPNFITSAEAATLLQGSPSAAVTIAVYGDIQCPYTAKLLTYLPQLQADFGDRVAVTFSHFPLGFHPQAKSAAIAADCAGSEEATFIKGEFANQASLGGEFFAAEAKKLGLDAATFKACLADSARAAAVEAEYKAGEARGVSSTPNYFIGDELVKGVYPYAELKAKLEKLMRK